jgi:rhamnosyltransferase
LYNPEIGPLLDNVTSIRRAGILPIIFDNTPAPEQRARNSQVVREKFGVDAVRWLREDGNIGLAAAYNRIVSEVRRLHGIEAILFLDQDSTVAVDSLQHLIATYRDIKDRESVGVLAGSALRSDGVPYRVYEIASKVAGLPHLTRVKIAPSSFSLIPMSAIERVGGFYDDFFIDHIDYDFCLRCRNAGLMVAIDRLAPFYHQIGNGLVMIAGRAITPISSPFRHYYQVRNILLSAERRGASRREAATEVLKRFAIVGVISIKAGASLSRYRFAWRGLVDGLNRRGGQLPTPDA